MVVVVGVVVVGGGGGEEEGGGMVGSSLKVGMVESDGVKFGGRNKGGIYKREDD